MKREPHEEQPPGFLEDLDIRPERLSYGPGTTILHGKIDGNRGCLLGPPHGRKRGKIGMVGKGREKAAMQRAIAIGVRLAGFQHHRGAPFAITLRIAGTDRHT